MNIATTKERIIQFIEIQKITVSEFLKKTKIKRGFLDSDKLKSSVSDLFIAKIIATYPQLNIEWLITGDGEMFKENREVPEVKANPSFIGIPLLPFNTFAGLGDNGVDGVNFNSIEERYVVPLFKTIKVDFMLQVRGSSMYPKYSSGDVVACMLIKELLYIQWNKVYVLDTISQGTIMKRLKKSNHNECVLCVSDNKEYDPFDLPKSEIRNIALVVGVIRLE